MDRTLECGYNQSIGDMEQYLIPFLIMSLLVVTLASLSFGTIDLNPITGLMDWFASSDSREALIVGEIRLPRTLLALIVGAAMALSGAALQGLFRNPLVDPGLIGASQGAALGAALVFYFNLLSSLGALATPVAGLIGAAITLFLLMGLSGSMARPAIIIMAVLAISSLASAFLAVVLNFSPNPYAIQYVVVWLLGSV